MSAGTELVLPKSQALAELSDRLSALQEQANALTVKDQLSYVAGAGLRTSLKSVVEAVKFQTGPRIAAAKEELERAKQEEAVFLGPAKKILETIDAKLNTFREEEKRAAKAEEDRINAERLREAAAKALQERREAEARALEVRKKQIAEVKAALKAGEIGQREAFRRLKLAGANEEAALQEAAVRAEEAKKAPPPKVEVKPNVPSVAGAPKNQTFYFGTVEKEGLILADYQHAVQTRDRERVVFLQRFITVDAQEVGKFARETRDNVKASKALPGCTFWSKG